MSALLALTALTLSNPAFDPPAGDPTKAALTVLVELENESRIEIKTNKVKEDAFFRGRDISIDRHSGSYTISPQFILSKDAKFDQVWLCVSYTGEGWAFIDELTLNADGTKTTLSSIGQPSRDVGYGGVYEHFVLIDAEPLLQSIADARVAMIEISGQKGHGTGQVSEAGKAEITGFMTLAKHMRRAQLEGVNLYDALNPEAISRARSAAAEEVRREREEADRRRLADALERMTVQCKQTEAPAAGMKGTFYSVVVSNQNDDDVHGVRIELRGLKPNDKGDTTKQLTFKHVRRRGTAKKNLALQSTKKLAAVVLSIGSVGVEAADDQPAKGTETWACKSCSGRGWFTCPSCGGKGYSTRTRTSDTGGRFLDQSTERVPCRKCRGGHITCKACHGTGK